jgi:predicted RND superfamily exporter protein
MAAIALLLLLTVRSIRGTVALMLPVLCTLLWLLGAMKWMQIKINPYNLVAFPVAIAYATIHGLHLYHRYEEEGLGSLDFVIRRAGRTVLITTLVGAAGFVPMAFADHRGLASLGMAAVLGLAFGVVAAMLLLPGLLGIWEARRLRRETAAIPSRDAPGASAP